MFCTILLFESFSRFERVLCFEVHVPERVVDHAVVRLVGPDGKDGVSHDGVRGQLPIIDGDFCKTNNGTSGKSKTPSTFPCISTLTQVAMTRFHSSKFVLRADTGTTPFLMLHILIMSST
jgi:hypothetical protein